MAFKGSPSSQHQHCTDEAQKAEKVLSAVRYIYIYIYIFLDENVSENGCIYIYIYIYIYTYIMLLSKCVFAITNRLCSQTEKRVSLQFILIVSNMIFLKLVSLL